MFCVCELFAMKTVAGAGAWDDGDEISISVGVDFELGAQQFACLDTRLPSSNIICMYK